MKVFFQKRCWTWPDSYQPCLNALLTGVKQDGWLIQEALFACSIKQPSGLRRHMSFSTYELVSRAMRDTDLSLVSQNLLQCIRAIYQTTQMPEGETDDSPSKFSLKVPEQILCSSGISQKQVPRQDFTTRKCLGKKKYGGGWERLVDCQSTYKYHLRE